MVFTNLELLLKLEYYLLPLKLTAVGSNAAKGDLGEVVPEVDGSLRDDWLAASMSCTRCSERNAQRIGSDPLDCGHFVFHRFDRKSL
jgi:hypothetical protein